MLIVKSNRQVTCSRVNDRTAPLESKLRTLEYSSIVQKYPLLYNSARYFFLQIFLKIPEFPIIYTAYHPDTPCCLATCQSHSDSSRLFSTTNSSSREYGEKKNEKTRPYFPSRFSLSLLRLAFSPAFLDSLRSSPYASLPRKR